MSGSRAAVPVDGSLVGEEEAVAEVESGVVTRARAKIIMIEEREYVTRLADLKGRHIAYSNSLPTSLTNTFNQNPDSSGVVNTIVNEIKAFAWS